MQKDFLRCDFKKIVNICIKNGWLDRNPFAGFKMTKREVKRPFLVEEELNRIIDKTFLMPRMNTYLKEIADACKITKKMTFHTARHTFATTVTLSNGVPIETVGRMLGHKNLKTTQHYARILDLKVSTDMGVLRAKFKCVEGEV